MLSLFSFPSLSRPGNMFSVFGRMLSAVPPKWYFVGVPFSPESEKNAANLCRHSNWNGNEEAVVQFPRFVEVDLSIETKRFKEYMEKWSKREDLHTVYLWGTSSYCVDYTQRSKWHNCGHWFTYRSEDFRRNKGDLRRSTCGFLKTLPVDGF